MVVLRDIRRFFRGEIRLAEPMARHTGLAVGGPADYFVEPSTRDDLIGIVTYFQHAGIPQTMMGYGRSLLVSDAGFRGAIIHVGPRLSRITMAEGECSVRAESGARVTNVVDFCVRHGYGGLEELSGISGSLGGAAVMDGLHTRRIRNVEVLRNNTVTTLPADSLHVGSREKGAAPEDVILAATFDLVLAEPADLMRERRTVLLQRNGTHPLNTPGTAVLVKSTAGRLTSETYDGATLGALRKGDAALSDRYPGLAQNLGTATASDFVDLLRAARLQSGMTLESAVRLVGFGEDIMRDVA